MLHSIRRAFSVARSFEGWNTEVNTATSISTGTTIWCCSEDSFLECHQMLELPWMVSLGHEPTWRCTLDSRIQLEVQWSMGNWTLVLHSLSGGCCEPAYHDPQNIDPSIHVGVCGVDSRQIVAYSLDARQGPWFVHNISDGLEHDQVKPCSVARKAGPVGETPSVYLTYSSKPHDGCYWWF